MKKVLIFLFLIISVNIFAVFEGEFTFIMQNPSAYSLALGSFSTGANIWNRNPLDLWNNPAQLGYYQGLSVGYSHNDYMEEVFNNIKFDSSYITFGWNGIGIMLPMINNFEKFGTSIDYGLQDMYDENAVFIGNIRSWQESNGLAFGFNVMEFYSSIHKEFKFWKYKYFTDLSLGYNYNFIHAHNLQYQDVLRSHADGLGMILRLSPLNELNSMHYGYLNTDLVLSLYYRNLSRTRLHQHGYKFPVIYSVDRSAALKAGIGIEGIRHMITTALYNDLSIFCKDLIAMKFYLGNSHINDHDWEIGNGIEISLLDLISLRWGTYDDDDGYFDDSFGIGINIHYHDLIHLQYNYTEYPEDLIGKQDISDLMVNFDLLALYHKVHN